MLTLLTASVAPLDYEFFQTQSFAMDPSPEKVAAMIAKYPSLKKVVETGIEVAISNLLLE